MDPANMDPININILYHSDFLGDRPLLYEPQTHKFIWWVLIVIEVLLFLRLMLEFFNTSLTSTFPHVLHTITQYVMYPFTTTLTGVGYTWVTIVAITGYFLIAITLVRFLKAGQYPRSSIERARTISRRKYS